MAGTFTLKRGDTSPALVYTLIPTTIDLTGATVKFQMRTRSGVTIKDVNATVVSVTDPPTLKYQWVSPDTDVADLYEAEFKVTYSDGKIETFPNEGFIQIRINEDVSDSV